MAVTEEDVQHVPKALFVNLKPKILYLPYRHFMWSSVSRQCMRILRPAILEEVGEAL